MPQVKVIVLDPHTQEPQRNIDVEAHNITSGVNIALARTDAFGVATFDIAVDASFHARVQNKPPLITMALGGGSSTAGAGPFAHDYLVDANWAAEVTAGRGTEGMVFTTFHGHTFKVYSTIQAAIDDIVVQDAKTTYSIGIVQGTYAENLTIPDSGSVSTVDHVSFYGLGSTYENIGSATSPGVRIIPGSGAAIDYGATGNSKGFYFENVEIKGMTHSGGGNATMYFNRCYFQAATVTIDGAGIKIIDCVSVNIDWEFNDTNDLEIRGCWFDSASTVDFSENDAEGVLISECNFIGTKIELGRAHSFRIIGCDFNSTPAGGDVIFGTETPTTTGIVQLVVANNTFSGNAPSSGNAVIRIDHTTENKEAFGVTIVGNAFNYNFASGSSTTAYIKLTGESANKVFSVVVANNTFGIDTSQAQTIEDVGGFSVIGTFVENSVFGPNTPVAIAKYKITDGVNNLFIPTSSDETGLPDSGSIPIVAPGSGLAPDDAQYLTLATDTDLTVERVFTPGTALSAVDSGAGSAYTLNHAQVATGDLHQDYPLKSILTAQGSIYAASGASTPAELAIGAASTILQSDGTDPAWVAPATAIGHAMLDGSIHTDSVADAVTAGSIIFGNDTPKWDELVISVPNSGARNVLGIDNGETVPSWKGNDLLSDADGDTKIQVEKSSDEDIIHFDVGGVTDVMTIADHGVDIHVTATETGEHALEFEVDAAGFGDVKAINIAYDTGALETGEAEAVVLLNIDAIDATGGDLFALFVVSTESGINDVHGLAVGVGVGPIHQDSGTFVNPTTGTNNTASTDVPDMIDGSTGTNTTIFVADNDFIIIGAAAAFTSIEFIIETPAGQPGIKPTFGYSISGSGQFTTFSPIDGTNGFKNTGVLTWETDELTGHVANDDTGTFDIKITRTHAVAGSVSLFFARSAAAVVYTWEADGKLTVNNIATDTINERIANAGVTVDGHLLLHTGTVKTHRWDTGDEQSYDTSTNTYKITIGTVDGIVATGALLQIKAVPVEIEKTIQVLSEDASFAGTLPISFIEIPSSTTLTMDNFAGGQGVVLRVFDFAATVQLDRSANPFIMAALFDNRAVFLNKDGETNVFGPSFVLNDQGVFRAVNAPLTLNILREVYLHPNFEVSGTGTLVVTDLDQIYCEIPVAQSGVTITTRRGLRFVDAVVSGTLTNQFGIDIEALTTGATLNIGIRNGSRYVATPNALGQQITAATDTIGESSALSPATEFYVIFGDASYTLTSTPTIPNGVLGQKLLLVNVDANDTITLQDQGTLGSSNLRLAATTIALGPHDSVQFIFITGALAGWVQVSPVVNVL